MKQIILTVAEFLLLAKIHKSEVFNEETELFINENAILCDPEILAGEVAMALSTKSFDDTIFAVDDYQEKMDKNDPEFQSIGELLKKLQAVEAEQP